MVNVTPVQQPPRLPVPSGLGNVDMLVQEKIHGHRFVQEQEPFMIVLETLAVYAGTEDEHEDHAAENVHETFHYFLPHRKILRFLIFRDRHLEKVVHDAKIPDPEKWARWKMLANEQYGSGQGGHDDFAHLDVPFEKNLERLHQAVRLLRSRELDVMHNRRWSSRFLSVTGPALMCSDMRVSGNNWSIDRRFFGRGGELVYLMLNRSSKAVELGSLIRKRFLGSEDPMNCLAQRLCLSRAEDKADSSKTQIGYLPYPDLPDYERIAEDWLNVLHCKKLPVGHLFEPLFRITALNLLVYLSERAKGELNWTEAIPVVADLTDGGNQHMREDAKTHLNLHRDAANRAVISFIKKTLQGNERWKMAEATEDGNLAGEAIEECFECKNTEPAKNPKRLMENFIQHAIKRDKNNIYKYLLPLARASGIATTRQGIGPWFALDDSILFALVLANVDQTIELRDFVARLHARYNLVIGPQEARKSFPRINVEAFESNLDALEMRMTRLALTERLSDDCAFVTNPYWSRM